MEVASSNYIASDPRLIDSIVYELKSQGIFDDFRKECISDVDTKPAYQNLRQRVEGSVSGFLKTQRWSPDMNKNQVREMLRKTISESGFLDTGVERIVDQVVNPKINSIFFPQVENVVYKYLGIEKTIQSVSNIKPLLEVVQAPELNDLLPKDLEAVSPEPDDKNRDEKMEQSVVESTNNDVVQVENMKIDDEESPPFEAIEDTTVYSTQDESSVDSHLTGMSDLTNHDSNHSLGISKTHQRDNPTTELLNSTDNAESNMFVNESQTHEVKMVLSEDSNYSRAASEGANDKLQTTFDNILKKDDQNLYTPITPIINSTDAEAVNSIQDNSAPQRCDSQQSVSDKNINEKHQKTGYDKHKSSDKHLSRDHKDRRSDKSDSKYKRSNSYKSLHDAEKHDRDRKKSSSKTSSDKSSERNRKNDKHHSSSRHSSSHNKNKSSRSSESGDHKSETHHRESRRESPKKESNHVQNEQSNNEVKEKHHSKRVSESSSQDRKEREKSDVKKSQKSSDSRHSKEKNSHHSSRSKSRNDSRSHHSERSHGDSKSRSKHEESKSEDVNKSSHKYKSTEKHYSSSSKKHKRDKDRTEAKNGEHCNSKEKKYHRRSTDRDSSDGRSGTHSSSSSFTEAVASSRLQKANDDSSKMNSGSNSGDSGNSDKVDVNLEVVPDDVENTSANEFQHIKLIKPKYASNIFEARRLLKIRKKISKIEKQNQLKLLNNTAASMAIANVNKESNEKHLLSKDNMKNKSNNFYKDKENKTQESDSTNKTLQGSTKFEKDSNLLGSSVISKESWDAVEAKLNSTNVLNIDYNSYVDVSDKSNVQYTLSSGDSQVSSSVDIEQNGNFTKSIDERKSNKVLPDSQETTILQSDNQHAEVPKQTNLDGEVNKNCLYLVPEVLPETQRYFDKIASKISLLEEEIARRTKLLVLHMESQKNRSAELDLSSKLPKIDIVNVNSDNEIEISPNNGAKCQINDHRDVQNNNKRKLKFDDVEEIDENRSNKLNTPENSKITWKTKKIKLHNSGDFSLPLSPADSENSISSNSEKHKVNTSIGRRTSSRQQSYTSDDLYKPRLKFTGSRRRIVTSTTPDGKN